MRQNLPPPLGFNCVLTTKEWPLIFSQLITESFPLYESFNKITHKLYVFRSSPGNYNYLVLALE